MFLKSLFTKKKSNDTTIDANNILETMSEEEIFLAAPMLFWKHSGNLAAAFADFNENEELEVDTAVLSWQFGRRNPLTKEEEQLFRKRVTDHFTMAGQKICFADMPDFREKRRLSDRI